MMNSQNRSRRSFLKIALAGYYSGISDLAFSQNSKSNPFLHSSKILSAPNIRQPFIVVFLRGGADGLSILSPLLDENFQAARPPEMRFSEEASSGRVEMGKTTLFWHPEATPLANLFNERKLIVWPAIGLLNETRSHFEAQEMIERGVDALNSLPDDLGWIARNTFKNLQSSPQTIPIFAGNNSIPRAMQGSDNAVAIRDLQYGVSLPNGMNGLNAVLSLSKADSQSKIAPWMNDHWEHLNFISKLLLGNNAKPTLYESAGKILYPKTDPGIGLQSVARLIEAKVGLEYAWVDQSGWDTHENQPGRLNSQIKNLSTSLSAFAQDMEARNQAYTLIVLTEFGRRLKSNRSNGTDHGHASLGLILGNNLSGGQAMGSWPGLSSEVLDRGVDLAVTTDYQKFIQYALNIT